MRLNRRKRRVGTRLKVVALGGGLALLLGVGISIVNVGEPDDGGQGEPSAGGLYTPRIEPEETRQAAIKYLVSQGVPRDEAASRMRKQTSQVRAATALRQQAPEDVQSVWIDDNGTLMAAVLNEDGEQAARAAGATPKLVTFAAEDLKKAQDTLAQDAKDNPPPGLNGASFEIDSVNGKVIAEYLFEDGDPVVPEVATTFGDMVVASAKVGKIQANQDVSVIGARMIRKINEGTSGLCTAAWAVDIEDPNGGTPGNGVMTAGHCFNDGDPRDTKYSIDTIAAGDTAATGDFSAIGVVGDFGYLRLDRDRGTTETLLGDVVEAIEEPVLGATVCKDGASSGETCGQIGRVGGSILMRLGNGVNFLLKGMVGATFCAKPGDSGAPVYATFAGATGPEGISAIGVYSSTHIETNGSCKSFFTPLSSIDSQGKYFIRIAGG